jgi:GDP-mannose 6-dehydrogenase
MIISVFGLGYVGAVSCACLAREGHTVIGVDVSQRKVDLINKGQPPIVERGLDELIGDGVRSGLIRATTDVREAVMQSDISLICVGTPSMINGNINLGYIYKVCEEIGMVMQEKDSYHSVVIRSTVSPGTLNNCSVIIQDASGKLKDSEFGIASNPEFLREGSAVDDFFNPPYTIIGTTSANTEKQLREIYSTVNAPVFCIKPEESEMIKYANNNFHALKITFANEIGNICKVLGIDSHVVLDMVVRDTKLNLSPYYLMPGFAFGGSCLPKDVRGLNYTARSLDLKTPMLSSLLESNDYQINRAVEMVRATGKKKIGVLGFSFKAGTDDLRESPVVTLIEILLGKGFQLSLYDSNVILSNLTGRNKEYITSHLPHISRLLRTTIDEVVESSEVLIIGTREEEFRNVINGAGKGRAIIDLVRINSERTSDEHYDGICW